MHMAKRGLLWGASWYPSSAAQLGSLLYKQSVGVGKCCGLRWSLSLAPLVGWALAEGVEQLISAGALLPCCHALSAAYTHTSEEALLTERCRAVLCVLVLAVALMRKYCSSRVCPPARPWCNKSGERQGARRLAKQHSSVRIAKGQLRHELLLAGGQAAEGRQAAYRGNLQGLWPVAQVLQETGTVSLADFKGEAVCHSSWCPELGLGRLGCSSCFQPSSISSSISCPLRNQLHFPVSGLAWPASFCRRL